MRIGVVTHKRVMFDTNVYEVGTELGIPIDKVERALYAKKIDGPATKRVGQYLAKQMVKHHVGHANEWALWLGQEPIDQALTDYIVGQL